MANIFVTGMTGTGKSYFIRYLLKQKEFACYCGINERKRYR